MPRKPTDTKKPDLVTIDEVTKIREVAERWASRLMPELQAKGHVGKWVVVRHDTGEYEVFDEHAASRIEQRKIDQDGVQRSAFRVLRPDTPTNLH